MTPFAAIQAVRTAGVVRGGYIAAGASSILTAAGHFGLRTDAEIYAEVSAERAKDILCNVVHRDLAYGFEFMLREEAEKLVASFLSQVEVSEARYFTNGTLGWTEEPPSPGRIWTPATAATLDTGVLVITSECMACLWVEDED